MKEGSPMSQSPTSRRKQRVLRSATTHITSDGLLQLLDIALDALLVIDQAGTIMMVNEQTEALFGTVLTEPTTGYVCVGCR
jgi:PAS domain-containing protein